MIIHAFLFYQYIFGHWVASCRVPSLKFICSESPLNLIVLMLTFLTPEHNFQLATESFVWGVNISKNGPPWNMENKYWPQWNSTQYYLLQELILYCCINLNMHVFPRFSEENSQQHWCEENLSEISMEENRQIHLS